MDTSPPLFLFVLLLLGGFGAAAMLSGPDSRTAGSSRGFKLLAVLPGVIMLGLFYSLAVHMHRSLGGWPSAIGNEGFPARLAAHAEVAAWLFGGLLLVFILAWPVAAMTSALVRRFRGALPYLGMFAVTCAICFAATSLAPSPFLYWWWD